MGLTHIVLPVIYLPFPCLCLMGLPVYWCYKFTTYGVTSNRFIS